MTYILDTVDDVTVGRIEIDDSLELNPELSAEEKAKIAQAHADAVVKAESVNKAYDEKKELEQNLVGVTEALGSAHPRNEFGRAVAVKDEDLPARRKDIMLPSAVLAQYGCFHCDWRGTDECPFGYVKPDKGCKSRVRINVHVVDTGRQGEVTYRICNKRHDWLCGFVRDGAIKPSVARWQHDYNMAHAEKLLAGDAERLGRMMEEEESAEKELEIARRRMTHADVKDVDLMEKELRKLSAKVAYLRSNYTNLWNQVMNYEGKQLDREEPKKVDMEIRHITVRDIQNIVSNAEIVKDAEFTETKGD